jgi:hypothetical protein
VIDARTRRAPSTRYFLIAGVLAVGVGLVMFGKTDPVRPSGPAATQMQALIERVVSANGGRMSASGCTMMGNVNLGVTCKVDGLRMALLGRALANEGWQHSAVAPLAAEDQHAAFVQNGNHLSIDADRAGLVKSISVRN